MFPLFDLLQVPDIIYRVTFIFPLVQLGDHKNVSGSNSTNIKLFCHVQSSLASQVTNCQNNIKVITS